MKKSKKIVVGLSGGVDSSISLLLLKKQGYQPIGVSLKYSVWENKRNILKENICCSAESFNIAKEICKKLNVPHYIIDVELDFKEKVIGYFLRVLKEKKTPNPCLVCNRLVKFSKLFNFAKKKGIKYVATGHYARVRENKETKKFELLKARDEKKDQSYFLSLLNQKQLKNIVFPLGNYTKEQVYKIAKKEGFDFFSKIKQSQDLCFVAKQSIISYLEEEIGFEPGEIIDQKNNVLGQHQGLHFYTIGQRRGIIVPNGPWWVIDFNRQKNQLIVTNQEDDPSLFRETVIISNPSFISGQAPKKVIKVEAKTRFSQLSSPAKLYLGGKKLVFDHPQKAITSGQWAVFYLPRQSNAKAGDEGVCLGGGEIK